MKQIKHGSSVIDTQLSAGYESSSGFHDAFSRIMGSSPSNIHNKHVFEATWINTLLGPMIAIADSDGLYLLEFVDRRGLEHEVQLLRSKMKAAIIPGENKILDTIRLELESYFAGDSLTFSVPIHLIGSAFQKSVWEQLALIPPGETRAYLDIAKSLNQPKSSRAVARANGANQLALIIPCHRVINSNGDLGGYGGGISRKGWLLAHEKKSKK